MCACMRHVCDIVTSDVDEGNKTDAIRGQASLARADNKEGCSHKMLNSDILCLVKLK